MRSHDDQENDGNEGCEFQVSNEDQSPQTGSRHQQHHQGEGTPSITKSNPEDGGRMETETMQMIKFDKFNVVKENLILDPSRFQLGQPLDPLSLGVHQMIPTWKTI